MRDDSLFKFLFYHLKGNTIVAATNFNIVINLLDPSRALVGNPRTELTMSGDGSSAKRGFSLLGFVSIIGKFSNKILDVVVKLSICKACEKWREQENTVEYEAWYEDREEKCDANHAGSAGKMEVDGVLELFKCPKKSMVLNMLTM